MVRSKDSRYLPRRDMYEIITDLENPFMVQDNAHHCCTAQDIGMLYASFVSHVRPLMSPGTMALGGKLASRPEHALQHDFQRESRKFLLHRLGDLVNTYANINDLCTKYVPNSFATFAPNSIEHEVARLGRQGEYTQIGEKLKIGAQQFHEGARARPLRAEYLTILHALQR